MTLQRETEQGFTDAIVECAQTYGWLDKGVLSRLLCRLRLSGDCWEWIGYVRKDGYGAMHAGGRIRQVHRVMFQAMFGEPSPGMHLDHLCRNRRCCNPAHLELVTPRENFLRGVHPTALLHQAGQCANGHSLAEHGSRRKSTGAVVYCRACRRERRAA